MAKIKVDFSDVEERKGAKHIEPGDYAVKVVKATTGKSGQKQTPQVSFELKIIEGPEKGSTLYHNCNLLPQSLWVLRNALEAMGFKIPKKQVNLDVSKCVGKKLAVTVDDDEWEGKIRSRVVDTFSIEELKAKDSDEEDEDLGDDEDEEDEDDDSDEEEDVEEVDLDEI